MKVLSHDHESASNLDDEAFGYNDEVHMNNSQKSAHLSYGGAVILLMSKQIIKSNHMQSVQKRISVVIL